MKRLSIFIVVFILLAFGLSAPVHLGFTQSLFQEETKSFIISNWGYLLAGFGPLIAGLIALRLHKNISHRISILGEERLKNTLISLLPLASFSIIGLDNSSGINIHYFGFLFAAINTIYAFFEEFAWRRYLQNALEPINKHLKYILIGIVWWLWHMRFSTDFDLYIFPLICIGGGYLLGKLSDDTRTIMPVVYLHTLIILLTNSGNVSTQKLIGVAISIIGWIVIEQIWKRKRKAT